MSQKGQVTSFVERVEIGERHAAGQSDREIAVALQRPLATVRKWRRRYKQEGRDGLTSRMGRPTQEFWDSFLERLRMKFCNCAKPIQAGDHSRCWRN